MPDFEQHCLELCHEITKQYNSEVFVVASGPGGNFCHIIIYS